MYKCTNGYKSCDGNRFRTNDKINESVYKRLPEQEKRHFEPHAVSDEEKRAIMPDHEGGFNPGSGFSTPGYQRPSWGPFEPKDGK